jgi:plasmid stabilization system protein ParE
VKLRILLEAEQEIAEALDWYEARRPGLGVRYLRAIDAAFERIVSNPESFPLWQKKEPYRKCVLLQFPYVLFFRTTPEEIVIAAVAHAKRHPRYWVRRSE